MRLGVSNYTGFDVTLNGFLSFASRLRVEFVELKQDTPILISLNAEGRWNSVKEILKCYSFKYILHAPSIDVNMGSLNPLIRKASEKTLLNAVHSAAHLDAKILVTHVGRLSRDYSEKHLSDALANSISSLTRVVEASRELGVEFTIENDHASRDQALASYPNQLRSIMRRTKCKLTFDVGHAYTLCDPISYIDEFGEEIANVHLHDNNGRGDSHLGFGEGTLNLSRVLEKLWEINYQGPLIIEVHSLKGLKTGVNWVKKLMSGFI